MISKPLFKASLKQNYIVLLIIIGVALMYLSIIISMYNPDMQESMNEMIKMMPKELISAMGYDSPASDLTGFITNYYYGFLILMLPMIYTIIVANRTMAAHVDKGSMAYLLSTPNTRINIALTQALFLLITTTLLIAAITLSGIFFSEILFPGELNISKFLLLNCGALLLYYALTGIGFFASCIFNDTKYSLAVGAGLPITFLLFQMLSGVGEDFEFLKYFTIYTLFDPMKIITGGDYGVSFLLLGVIAVVTYSAAILSFHKRDLPL